MSKSFSCEYGFDELRIFGEGLLAYGTATLVEDGDDAFYVSTIVLDDGTRFDRKHGSGALGSEFTKRLFDLMAIEIENDSHAQDFFNEKIAEYHEPVERTPYYGRGAMTSLLQFSRQKGTELCAGATVFFLLGFSIAEKI